VTDQSPGHGGDEPFEIDRTTAHPERIYNYLLGGDDNFAADRQAALEIFELFPGGLDAGRALIRAMAKYIGRVVHYVGEMGIRQFINVSTVFPMLENMQDLVERAAPRAHVLYVVRDPTVLAQAHRLVRSSPGGKADVVHSDLRDPVGLMEQAGQILDFTQPVAVMALGTLTYLRDERDPHGLVATLMEPVPPGSYLMISHMASDLRPAEMDKVTARYRQRASSEQLGFVPRSHAEVSRFFDGLELVGSGVVSIDRWRPGEAAPPRPDVQTTPTYGGVARKP
jgi:hypothetical protein